MRFDFDNAKSYRQPEQEFKEHKSTLEKIIRDTVSSSAPWKEYLSALAGKDDAWKVYLSGRGVKDLNKPTFAIELSRLPPGRRVHPDDQTPYTPGRRPPTHYSPYSDLYICAYFGNFDNDKKVPFWLERRAILYSIIPRGEQTITWEDFAKIEPEALKQVVESVAAQGLQAVTWRKWRLGKDKKVSAISASLEKMLTNEAQPFGLMAAVGYLSGHSFLGIETYPFLKTALSHKDPNVHLSAIYALFYCLPEKSKFTKDEKSFFPLLMNTLSDNIPYTRELTVHTLWGYHEDVSKNMPVLVKLADDPDVRVRKALLRTLAAHALDNDSAAAVIIKYLSDEDKDLRGEAAVQIGFHLAREGPKAGKIITDSLAAAGKESSLAILTHLRVNDKAEAAVAPLKKYINSEDLDVRVAAVRALIFVSRAEADKKNGARILMDVAKNKEAPAANRLNAVQGLEPAAEFLGPCFSDLIDVLVDFLENPGGREHDARYMPDAISRVLGASADKGVRAQEARLSGLLLHDDARVRHVAKAVLGKMMPEVTAHILDVLQKAEGVARKDALDVFSNAEGALESAFFGKNAGLKTAAEKGLLVLAKERNYLPARLLSKMSADADAGKPWPLPAIPTEADKKPASAQPRYRLTLKSGEIVTALEATETADGRIKVTLRPGMCIFYDKKDVTIEKLPEGKVEAPPKDPTPGP